MSRWQEAQASIWHTHEQAVLGQIERGQTAEAVLSAHRHLIEEIDGIVGDFIGAAAGKGYPHYHQIPPRLPTLDGKTIIAMEKGKSLRQVQSGRRVISWEAQLGPQSFHGSIGIRSNGYWSVGKTAGMEGSVNYGRNEKGLCVTLRGDVFTHIIQEDEPGKVALALVGLMTRLGIPIPN